MYGQNVGGLRVLMASISKNTTTVLWENWGNQGDQWNFANISLNLASVASEVPKLMACLSYFSLGMG